MAVPLTSAASPTSRHRSRPGATGRGQRGAIAVLIGPFFVLFAAVVLAPVGYAAWMSLFSEQSSGLGFGASETLFVGVDNFVKALTDPVFGTGLLHVAAYCAVYIPVMIGSALVLALLLDSAYAGAKRVFQLGLFLPHAVPGLIAAIIWVYLYTPGLSPVVSLIEALGGELDFFGADVVLFSMVNIAAWQWIGYNVIIFFAALQAVPRETLEAAVVDGAGAIRTAMQIKVPTVRPAVVLVTLFTCVGAIQLFTEPKVLEGSNNAPSLGAEWSPVMYILNAAFVRHDYGLAAASSLLLAALAGLLSYAVTKLGNRWRSA